MGRLLMLLALLCALAQNQARAEDEETWLNSTRPENSSYFAPKVRFSQINDRLAIWPGVGLGWIVGSVISVGFEGYILANDLKTDAPDTARFNMAVGGMML